MPRIRLLPDTLVSQIAAGEVVERPASVVKELVENALDAGATSVEVELDAGGKGRIRVVDDGAGMGRDDALLAFDRHATSKIGSVADLERVGSLGFRGEALAAIASVGRVELVTAETAGDGTLVRIEGGEIRGVEPTTRARGTTIEVGDLFFNTPARREFMKRPSTELRHCVEVVQGYALARPDVRFRLEHEGRELLDAPRLEPSTAGARERIRQVFGAELATELESLPEKGVAGDRVWGFVGNRQTTRGRRIFVFVNGRLLRDRAVLAIFYRAVRREWKSDDYPALFLFLEVPPDDLDVNVHPQKAEVRFRDRRHLDRVAEVLSEGLQAVRREGEAPLRPMDRRQEGRAFDLSWEGLGSRWGVGEEVREGGVPSLHPGTGKLAEVDLAPELPSRPVARVPLSGPGGEDRSVRILGQYKGALVLLEAADALLLVDQHAAHERILYEEFVDALDSDGGVPMQRLLVPRLLELAVAEAMRLRELAPDLERLGFLVEPLSGGDLALAAVPSVLEDDEAERVVCRLASDEEAPGGSSESVEECVLSAVAAEQACKTAITIHHPLGREQIERLISDLFACRDPYSCPHGRPTVLKMGDAELERRFGRR